MTSPTQRDYRAWLDSPAWAAHRVRLRRRPRLRRCAFHGHRCHGTVLDLHHWARGFYRRRGREAPWMLVGLCRPVHEVVHVLCGWLFRSRTRGLVAVTVAVVTVGKLLQVAATVVAVTGRGRP